jgi:hypothetical protein
MRANLKINKDIIEDFYKSTKENIIGNTYSNKLREEVELLTKRNADLKSEIGILLNKIAFFEQITNANLLEYRDSHDSLNNKIFILENAIVKKDNLLQLAQRRINRLTEKQIFEENARIEREIFVYQQFI